MKKGVNKGLLITIIVILALIIIGVVGYFVILPHPSGSSNQNQGPTQLSQNTFSSCQSSTQTIPFGPGSYTINVFGIVNGTCHWRYSNSALNQTKDCYYPLNQMSSDAFNHLFGQDKTGTQCISTTCQQQDSLLQTYCK